MSEPAAEEASRTGDAVATPSASWWEDFIDILYAPSTVFRRREHSGFLVPMLVVTLVVGTLVVLNSGVLQPVMDAEFTRATAAAMKKNPNVSAEMMEKMRGTGEKIAKVGAFVIMPVLMFCVGLILWLCGKMLDARQTVAQAIMVSAFAMVPRIIENALNGVQGLLLDPSALNGRYRLTLGPGRFLDPDTASPVLLALVGRLDLFTLWVTVLLAIGLAVTGRISRQRAMIAGVLVWIIGGLLPLLQAMRA